jgi:hypothetical protein
MKFLKKKLKARLPGHFQIFCYENQKIKFVWLNIKIKKNLS